MKSLNNILSFIFIGLIITSCESNSEMLESDAGSFKEEYAEQEYASESMDEDLGTSSDNVAVGYKASVKANGSTSGLTKTYNDSKTEPETRSKADKIIKRGNLGVEVKDYHKDKHYFEDIIRKYDAYKSNENERTESNRISNTIEIRLSSKHFDNFMDEIAKGEGIINIDYKRTSATDVGEEYTDLQTRIATKKEVEKRYIEILRKAKTIPDILQVENQIRVIREEIESKEGRLRFLKDRISYSTITLYIYEQLEYNAPPTDKPSFWGKLGNALLGGWNGILAIILVIVRIWPFVLLIVGGIILYRKRLLFFKKRS